jgi:hypothetical protein
VPAHNTIADGTSFARLQNFDNSWLKKTKSAGGQSHREWVTKNLQDYEAWKKKRNQEKNADDFTTPT